MKGLLVAAFIFLAGNCYAGEFQWTDLYAVDVSKNESVYASNVSKGSVGGPSWSNNYGWAAQFQVNSPTSLSCLIVDARILAPWTGTTSYVYRIYSGTYNSLPDLNSLVFSSAPVHFSSETDTVYNETREVPFQFELGEGTYWLAAKGSGPLTVFTDESYGEGAATAREFSPVVAPEPSSYLLMIAGAFCMGVSLLNRRFRLA